MIFQNDYERIKFYYDNKWASKEQVAMYVYYGVITEQQYQDITGDVYAA